jgi:hypothetical protein
MWDNEPNPSPWSLILKNHPGDHKSRNKTYFIPNTVKFRPEYKHISKNFALHLKCHHPFYFQHTQSHLNLNNIIQSQQPHPPPRLLYVIIAMMHPSPNICEQILHHQPNPY